VTPVFNAAVTAAGRLGPEAAKRYGTDIKALVRIGGRTLLATLVAALRGVPAIERIIVVGPAAARDFGSTVDTWLDECATGEDNVLAALRGAGGGRLVVCASDLPFVTAHGVEDLVARAPSTADCAYPIFTREEFVAAFPGGRSSFARLADGEWTGGSVLVLNADLVLRHERLLRRAFAARKNLMALAALLGPALALRYVTGRLRVDDVQARIGALTGGAVVAIRGADPALAMDCDEPQDFEFAQTRLDRVSAG
jgi:molybdopterin-guanine dinucleotide biosynthesis protein A